MKQENLKKLIKDFMRSGNMGSFKLPEMHENIEWILKNCTTNEVYLESYLRSKNTNLYNYSKDFISLFRDKKNIFKRMENIVEQGFKFTDEGCAIARLGSLDVLKLAIDNGLDINFFNERERNYILRNSILRRKPKLTEYLWNLPGIKKDYIDLNAENIVHIAADRDVWFILIDELRDNPEKFQVKNKYNKTPLDKLISKDWDKVPEKNINLIKKTLLNLIEKCEELANFNELENITPLMIENRERFENMQKNLLFKELIIMNNYNKLNQMLPNKNENKKKVVVKI